MSVFGFSTETAGGDFLPIIKFDARSGRITRVDRVQDDSGIFVSEPVDITQIFKAIVDFENVEVGWIQFSPNSAPDFRLVPIGSQLPPQPSENHKNGLRLMLKLSKECSGGEPPIREIAGNSKAFLSGFEAVYMQYLKERDKYPGKLPVLTLEKTTPVKTGSGLKSSTNYHPIFRISGWAPRGDLVFEPKAQVSASSHAPTGATGATPPSTGSTRAEAPKTSETVDADDFG